MRIPIVSKVMSAFNHRTALTTGALSLMSTAIVVAAVQADGSTATNVRLDDGAVWVTNHEKGLVGRLNLEIDELDFGVRSANAAEVLQDTIVGSQATPIRSVVFSASHGGIQTLDVMTGQPSGSNEIPIVNYRIGGGVAAAIDPETGRLWVGSAQQIVASDYPSEADALVEPGSHLVVTQAVLDDEGRVTKPGAVIIVDGSGWYEVALDDRLEPVRPETDETAQTSSTTSTTTTTLAPLAEGTLPEPDPEPIAEPVVTPIGALLDDIADVSSVGVRPVVLTVDGELVLDDGTTVDVPGDQPRLQRPGPAFDNVLVGSSSGLYEVSLDDGTLTELTRSDGIASAPVRVGPCAYGAWSSDEPSWAKTCSATATDPAAIPDAAPGAELVFRVNGPNVAINSTGNGDVWADHEGTLAYVGNWSDVEPRDEDSEDVSQTTGESRVVVEKTCIEGGAEAPTTGDDQLGVRPRQTIIDVLNNDDDVNCEPIAITSVDPVAAEWGAITIIDNGQHLLYSPSDEMVEAAAEQIETFQFTYTVSDIGLNESKPATVTVSVKDFDKGNLAPALRPKNDDTTREMKTVVEEGRSVSYNVIPDWWDPDGDDLRLVSAVPEGEGEVAATPDGIVRFSAAGVAAGVHSVAVTMSDGAASVTETMEVTVKPVGSAIEPVTSDDFVTIAVDDTVTISPLANDSDPNETPLTLKPLWTSDEQPGYRAAVRGDDVEITGVAAGVYGLEYEATDGTDSTPATIRLEVVAPGEINSAPIAVPDQVKLRANRVVNVDVLANDVDADQDLLAVIDVDVATSDPTLGIVRASIVDRRMVQVEVVPGPQGETPTGPFVVTYRVTDGRDQERLDAGRSTEEAIADQLRGNGAVSVLVQPPSDDQPPTTTRDTVTVRSGDVASVPVLRNDVDPDGDQITLVGVSAATADKYEADAGGVIWTEGREVLVQGGAPGRYDVTYTIEAGGKPASGALSVIVKDLPNPETNPNNPPEPPDLQVRAIRNGTVRVKIPSFGIDPDGDSVDLLEDLGTPSETGNSVVLDLENPGVILFTAGPRSGPEDSFTYAVEDRFGDRGRATVRVMVLDDGGWPPQAHDDVFVGKPGRVLSIPVVANDTSPHDRAIEIAELPFFDSDGQPTAEPTYRDSVTLLDQTDPDTRGYLEVVVPTDGTVLVEHYRITDGFNPSDAYVRVTPDPDAPNVPPVARPDEIEVADIRGLTEISHDVVANDFDPDDAESPLTLTVPASQNASVADGEVLVPLQETSQIILYRVTDSDDATTVGMLRVPGLENHPPTLSDIGRDPTQREIDAATGEPMTILLDVITEDEDGDTDIELTDTELVQPSVGSVVRLDDGSGFVYTPPEELTTSETVTIGFEVTDRPERSVAERELDNCNCVAALQVQLIVKASSPPYVVASGSTQVPVFKEPVTYDLAPLTRDDQDDPLTYELDSSTFGGLDVSLEGSTVRLESSDPDMVVGRQIPIRYTVSDGIFPEIDNSFVVTIIATNKGQPSTASFETLQAERDEPISTPNFVDPAFNPFAGDGEPLTLINSSVTGGASLNCQPTGDCEFLSTEVGTFTVSYTLEDVIGQTVNGTLEVVVKGKPRAPGVPVIESVGDHQVTLTWTAADMQGAEFVTYHVTAVEDGVTKQFTETGGVFDGLENAKTYHFTVVAENALGMGEESAQSTGAIPDRVPDPPEALVFTDYQDQTLSVDWEPPSTAGDFSAIVAYEVKIGGQIIKVDGGTTSLTIGLGGQGDPLTNGVDYSFDVRAQNSATTDGGWGAWSGASGSTERPSRHPDTPTNVVGVNSGDGGTPRITVTWNAPGFDGGRPITEYRVCRVEDGTCLTTDGSTTQATFDQPRNQTTSFTVVAYNNDKNRNDSDVSAASAGVTSVGTPDAPVISSVQSGDHQLVASASTTNNSGCNSYSIQYSRNGGSTWQASGTFTGLTNGQQYTIIAKTVLDAGCYQQYESPNSAGSSQTPYGNLQTPYIRAERSGTRTRYYWETRRSDDGRPGWSATLSSTTGGTGCSGATLSSNQGASGYTSWKDVGYSVTGGCQITVNAQGANSKSDSDSITTEPRPYSISISTGGTGCNTNGICPGTGGRWINVTLSNYPPNTTFTVYNTIQTRDNPSVTTNGSGTASVGDGWWWCSSGSYRISTSPSSTTHDYNCP